MSRSARNAHPSLEAKLEQELELLEGFLRRAKLTWLLHHFPPRPVWAGFVCINGFIAIGLLSLVAMASRSPFVFPPLGPTAYVLFFTPRAPAASPKHAMLGHLVGLICGWAALWMTGLIGKPGTAEQGVNLQRALAAAVSLGATGAVIVLLKISHPPAGATTLIVSLGFITRVWHLLVIEAAVLVLIAQAIVVNRLAGIDYPLWAPHKHPAPLPRPATDAV